MILPWQVTCERDGISCCQVGELAYVETRPHGDYADKRSCWINGRKIGLANNDEEAMKACESAIRLHLGEFQGVSFIKRGNVELKVGRLEDEEVEAIVCPWGKDTGLAGVSASLVKAGGDEFLGFMRKIDTIKVGQARISTGGKLPCRFVVHVACPSWKGGSKDEMSKLEECYSACATGFRDLVIREASFPCLSMGGNLFPLEKATSAILMFAKFVSKSRILRRFRVVTPSKDVFWSLRSMLMEDDE